MPGDLVGGVRKYCPDRLAKAICNGFVLENYSPLRAGLLKRRARFPVSKLSRGRGGMARTGFAAIHGRQPGRPFLRVWTLVHAAFG